MEDISQKLAMPKLGFGTFRMPGDGARTVVESALEVGYRHLDTAAMYDNEAAVGSAIAASGVSRREIFLTTKVWHDQLSSRDSIRAAFDESLAKLKVDYVDLYMVHWPSADMDLRLVMETLVELQETGTTKAIGVCNFNLPMIQHAVDELHAPVAALQVEYHPFLSQTALLSFVRKRGIQFVAYAPLAQGRAASDEVLAEIGRKHGVGAAQIAIAWLISQDGVAAIPKAGRRESQEANLEALKVVLDQEDLDAIRALPKDQRYVRPPFAPDWDATTL